MSFARVLMLAMLPACVCAEPTTITGTVVDEGGEAVAGAEVWVIGREYTPWQIKLDGSTESNPQGEFAVPDVDLGTEEKLRHITVAAYREGLGIGWVSVHKVTTGLEIVCETPVPIEGRVATPEGKGIAAEITPSTLYHRPPALDERALYFPDELKERFKVKTGPDGGFVFDWVPKDVSLRTDMTAAGYGKVSPYGDPEQLRTITLSPAGSIRGRVICEPQPKTVSRLEVSVRGYDRERGLSWGGKATTDEQGELRDSRAPAGPPWHLHQARGSLRMANPSAEGRGQVR